MMNALEGSTTTVLVAVLRRIERAHAPTGAKPLDRESWLNIAAVLEGQAQTIRKAHGGDIGFVPGVDL